MSISKTDILTEVFDAVLITAGARGASFIAKKVVGDSLGVPSNVNGLIRLTAAIATGSLLVQFLQKKKIMPDNPFS